MTLLAKPGARFTELSETGWLELVEMSIGYDSIPVDTVNITKWSVNEATPKRLLKGTV